MMKLQLLLAFSFFAPGVVSFDDPHDTDGLCADKGFTGFKATRDCRGYVHCAEGRLTAGHANGGVISCWPNQLFDEELGICAHWTVVDRKGQHCPDFRQEMMMPDVKDENAMEEYFFCGETANHAATICEPCEGGSRLECKNPIHNCFAKITRCARIADTGSNVSKVEEPDKSYEAKESTLTKEPTKVTTEESAGLVTPSSTPIPSVAANKMFSSPTFDEVLTTKVSRKTNSVSTCGVSWALMVGDCSKSQPCPSGLNEECPTGQICFTGSPCGESNKVTSNDKTAVNVSSQSSAGDVPTCGVSWALMVGDCSKSQPCPSGLNEECPTGQTCFTGSPCGESNEVTSNDKTAVNVSSQSSAGDVPTCGVSWALMVGDCSKSQPCPSGLNEECPTGQTCFSGSPCGNMEPVMSGSGAESEQVMLGEAEGQIITSGADTWNTCGVSWSWMVNDCESAKPCPSGSNDECPSGETCFAGSPCGLPASSNKKERKEYCSTKLDWLKDLNECSTPSSCPKDGSNSCPSGYKCVDCRAQIDTPTLEVRCVPHSQHTSVEGCSVRCCVLE